MSGLLFWYRGRSEREQRLLLLMLVIAVPLLLWLLVYRPVTGALDAAWDRHRDAVERHGQVLAAVDAAKAARQPIAAPVAGEIAALAGESAGRAGLTLSSAAAQGSDRASVSIAGGEPRAMLAWLGQLEAQGVAVEDLRMTPAPDGSVSLTAVLARRGR